MPRMLLTTAGLTVGTVTYEYYDDVAKGQVVSQTVTAVRRLPEVPA